MQKHRPHIIRRRGRPQKSPPWIKYELKTREDLDRFLVDAIKASWTGKLGTRQASAVNGSIRLLMELRTWRQLPPVLPPPQGQTAVENTAEYMQGYQKGFDDVFGLLSSNPELKDQVTEFCSREITKMVKEKEQPKPRPDEADRCPEA